MSFMFKNFFLITFASIILNSCDFMDKLHTRVTILNNYESIALELSKKNRRLKEKISTLEEQLQVATIANKHFEVRINKILETREDDFKRKIAFFKNPYKKDELSLKSPWKIEKIHALARSHLKNKEFKKSSEYFQKILKNYPKFKYIDDQFYLQAGIAAYEAKIYFKESILSFKNLIEKYPESPYYKSAKMWLGLTYLKSNDTRSFLNIVKEFQIKYKDSSEWILLSQYYEEIIQRYE